MSSTPARPPTGWIRRLSPLSMGVVALALVLTIFPSSLHVPITGPNGTTEVAPVPGQSRQQSSVSEGSAADSGTVGAGGSGAQAGGGDAGGAGADTDRNPPGVTPQRSSCVGNPPRQTDDPLSPPCVPTWTGQDNGGSTMHGVTRDTIHLVAITRAFGRSVSLTGNSGPGDTPYERTAKTLLRYFESHFVTYGRSVVLDGFFTSQSGNGLAADVNQRFHSPLGVFMPDRGGVEVDFARQGIESFNAQMNQTNLSYPERRQLQAAAPYAWFLGPTIEDITTAGATWLCDSMIGRPASMANDPRMQAQTRKMALVYTRNSDRPIVDAVAAAARARCSAQFDGPYQPDNTGAHDAPLIAHMQGTDHDTTLVCVACNLLTGFQNTAEQAAYLPEWLFLQGTTMDNVDARGNNPHEWQGATGLTWRWRQPAIDQQYWYQAYESIDPATTPDLAWGSTLYESLMQAFGAIQLAGPQLTPAALETGMRRWQRLSPTPYSPNGDFGPGSHNFIKDVMQERWDAAGVPPGGAQATVGFSQGGCYRLVEEGKRHDGGRNPWPADDEAAARNDWPCQAEEVGTQTGD